MFERAVFDILQRKDRHRDRQTDRHDRRNIPECGSKSASDVWQPARVMVDNILVIFTVGDKSVRICGAGILYPSGAAADDLAECPPPTNAGCASIKTKLICFFTDVA